MKDEKKKEEQYYETIKEKLDVLFKEKGVNIYLEITARKMFSRAIKNKIPKDRDIIFSFLEKFKPDITGFVEGCKYPGYVVVEVKKEIDLGALYQLKRYADLFKASFAFLVYLEPISIEFKRLLEVTGILAGFKAGYYLQAFILTRFDEQSKKFVEWFEKNPFEDSYYWK